MKDLFTDDFENILNEASFIDEDIDRTWIYFTEEDHYAVVQQIFDRENYCHYDDWSDEFVEVDYQKALKKILRGKNIPDLIRYVFDFGRLVGRSEKILLDQPTPCTT